MTSKNAATPLVERLLGGEKLALARAITAVENNTPAAAGILQAIAPHLGRASVLGFTGPPGAGKSTLINAFVAALRDRAQSVAVLAVDPSSPLSGGAILGDRIRMSEHVADPGVFVRSLASRGHLGGLSRATAHVIDLMDAAGWDTIILETVGAGQSEFEMTDLAHTNIVLLAPGLGDDIQAMKAGILEIADILVVNKADLPGAGTTASQLKSMLSLRPDSGGEVPVIETVATTGAGVDQLADAVSNQLGARDKPGGEHQRRQWFRKMLANAAIQQLDSMIKAGTSPNIEDLCARLQRGEIHIDDAVQRLLHSLEP
ncbi:MAG: methylmalonyl Co-A mutase-associated GTPase MeaB [Rhodospirillaceae bacterium]|jgi:LAO/AO transport system kinase|nr:methylmalonyl Co-A mutase-associated GTPase MeaB [Rhodospirillaceae bacterium]MBT5082163.1 methylmalonyl Co-A mutase-associated GTPase MeaB [Rhodospirillaceae bacterium]MBT5523698.1 methylmalonyl Co-A mutase-associated GTPase MeaB [Rhodospirillaceae bacterium]MBT5879998.1 methylmalonyl Co-A mutase-associated GTPase MeaB [Rhodospirillaceae bacterium]MBT6589697.1 methylmalonyl Co-A mutase-associated GTPase MeaB [Rhodospirillaceae bacterium]